MSTRSRHPIKRTPFGYISEVTLPEAGVKERIQYHDSDNDGLWTSMYGAESPLPLRLLGIRCCTQGTPGISSFGIPSGSHSEGPTLPPGYVAHAHPINDLADPNDGRLERDKRFAKERDSLWKVYEPRWPVSAMKVVLKSDTSSDELDGHFFFYPLYYDLVAQTDDEKMAVRKVVAA